MRGAARTLVAALLAPLPALADAGAVAAALRVLDDARQDDAWHFTMTLVHNGEQRTVSHDPELPAAAQRTLLAVDGAPPDRDELEAFRDAEAQRIADRDPEASYTHLVDLDTLRATTTAGDIVEYAFSPRVQALQEHRDSLRGALALNTATGAVEKIELTSTAPFSPAFSVTLDSYRLTFEFRQEQGARLLDRMESVALGRAGFVKSFEERVAVAFSHYRPAAAVTE